MKVVISLGGSIIVPDEIDSDFLEKFKKLVLGFVDKGYKFVIFCGGGRVARDYQKVAKSFGAKDEDLDLIGISATKMNANLVRTIFGLDSFKSDPNSVGQDEITVMSGWKPGWSTDYDVVIVAKKIKADVVINITDVEYVYDKNPKEFPDAKLLEKITWDEMGKLVGDSWKPGMNIPFDPVATKNAKGLKVIITGKNLDNLKKILSGKEFKGTVIS